MSSREHYNKCQQATTSHFHVSHGATYIVLLLIDTWHLRRHNANLPTINRTMKSYRARRESDLSSMM